MNETSSDGLALTADTSTVNAADLGSVFQRKRSTHRQQQQQQPRRQHGNQQSRNPHPFHASRKMISAEAVPAPAVVEPYEKYSTSHSDANNRHITHHLYGRATGVQPANAAAQLATKKRLYHHEESVAPHSLLSFHEDVFHTPAKPLHDASQQNMLANRGGKKRHQNEHRYANIEPPHSHTQKTTRKLREPIVGELGDDSATRRRLRYLLDHDFDDDALYYDDNAQRGEAGIVGDAKRREKESSASSSLKKTLLIVVLVCIVAAIGVIWLLYSSGEGNIARGFKRLFEAPATPQGSATVETLSDTRNNQSVVSTPQSFETAAQYEKRPDEWYDEQTHGQDSQITSQNVSQNDQWYHDQYEHEGTSIDLGPAYSSGDEQITESGRRVRFNDVASTYYYPSEDHTTADQHVYPQQEHSQEGQTIYDETYSSPESVSEHYVPNPKQGLAPASLVPGAENRSRVDMARELDQPDLGKNIALIYDSQKSKGILSNPDATAMFDSAGGAEASRYMGFTEPPEYDPTTDMTLNVEENAGKSMASLYDQHKQKMDPLYGIHQPPNQPRLPLDRTQSVGGGKKFRPQRRADTEPMQHIVSADENYSNTQQRRKRIAVRSQAAVSSIYDKKIQQHSATSAHFVHDPATSNGIEYMNVHDQTYLGEEDR